MTLGFGGARGTLGAGGTGSGGATGGARPGSSCGGRGANPKSSSFTVTGLGGEGGAKLIPEFFGSSGILSNTPSSTLLVGLFVFPVSTLRFVGDSDRPPS